jgi:Domain of unknown function (DUF4440)
MDRIPLLLALVIGFLLTPGNATAQRPDKQTTRSGRNTTTAKAARTSHTASTKSSSKTSKATAPSVATSAAISEETAKALEAQDVERVTAFEQERIQADIKKEKGWFDDYLGEDLTNAGSDGRLENKVQLIARCLDPSNIVESEKDDELSVRAYGDVIVVTGTRSQTGKGNNVPYSIKERFTDVWVSQGGLWRQVAMHVSPIGATDGASQSAATPARQPQNTKAGAASELQSAATQAPQLSPRTTASASPIP